MAVARRIAARGATAGPGRGGVVISTTMAYELPRVGFDPDADVVAPMLSIIREDSATGVTRTSPWRIYLRQCDRQAGIALSHLDSAWALLGEIRSLNSEDAVWAELQGALTAGIILSRLLKPGHVRSRSGMSIDEAKAKSKARGEHLRELLDVNADSSLLTIAAIRDPIEHFDERIDAATEAGAWSLSDWYVAREGYIGTPTANGTPTGRHTVGLRVFAPLPGLLIFDDKVFDLFAWEDELFGLQNAMPQAIARAEAGLMSFRTGHIGLSQIYVWNPEDVGERRSQWVNLRKRRNKPMPVEWPPPSHP